MERTLLRMLAPRPLQSLSPFPVYVPALLERGALGLAKTPEAVD